MSKKMSKKPIILILFLHFPNFTPLPLLNFGMNPKFDHVTLCVYYQSYVMQSLMFLGCFDQKLSKKNLWGIGPTLLGTGRVKMAQAPIKYILTIGLPIDVTI